MISNVDQTLLCVTTPRQQSQWIVYGFGQRQSIEICTEKIQNFQNIFILSQHNLVEEKKSRNEENMFQQRTATG